MPSTLRKQPLAANDMYPKSSAHIITFVPRSAQPDRMLLVAVTAAMIMAGFMMGIALRNMPSVNIGSGMNFALPVSVSVEAPPTALPARLPVSMSLPPVTFLMPSAPAMSMAPTLPAPMATAPLPPAPVPAAPPHVETPALYDITLPEDGAIAPVTMTELLQPMTQSGAQSVAQPAAQVAADTETFEQMIKRAQALLSANNLSAALALYEHVLSADEDNPSALAGEAYVLQATGNNEQAADAFRRLLALDPADTSARDGLASALGHAEGNFALKELQKLAQEAPASATIQAAMARYLSRHNDMKGAFDHLLRALELEPGNAVYRLDLAVFYDRAGNAAAALALYRQALEDASNSDGQSAFGDAAKPALPLNAIRARVGYLAEMSGGFQ